MAEQKLTDRQSLSTSSDSSLIHVVEGGSSYKQTKDDFLKEDRERLDTLEVSDASQGTDIDSLESRVDNLEENQYTSVVVYDTLADLPATGTALVSYKVTNDSTSSNNGYYHWSGSAYVKDASLFIGEVAEGDVDGVEGGKIFTAISDIYSDYQEIPFTTVDGRFRTLVSYDDNEVSTFYNKTSPIYLKAGQVVYVDIIQAASTVNIAFDKGGFGISLIPPNENFTLPYGTEYISLCTIKTDLLNAKLYLINGVNVDLVDSMDDILEGKKPNLSANLWEKDKLIPFSQVSITTGDTTYRADKSSTSAIPIEAETDYVFFNFYNILGRNFAFYDSTMTFISGVNVVSSGYDFTSDKYFLDIKSKLFTTPANAAYIKFEFHNTSDFTVGLDSFKIFKRSDWAMLLDDFELPRFNNTYNDIYRNIEQTTKQVVNLYDKNVLILGDSISSNGTTNYYGGWVKQLDGLLKPKQIYRYSQGGATLTDTSGVFGADYITLGNNSLIKQAEQYIADYNALTTPLVDIIFIYGGVNDYDLNRYVTLADIGTTPYDEYVERNYFTSSVTNQLLDLSTIDRGNAVGALRYIVERIGEVLPNVHFYIMTPPQTLLHSWVSQNLMAKEVKWAANRLSIPCIDVWGSSGTPLLSWEYPTVGEERYIEDTVHDYDTEASDIRGRFIVNEFINKHQFYTSSF